MTVGNFLTAVIMGVAMIFLSRSMGPENFGIFSVSMSIMFILSRLVDLGLDQLIPRFVGLWHKDEEKKQFFLAHILWWKILLSGLLLVIGLSSLSQISAALSYPHQNMIAYSIVGAVLLGLYNYVYMLLTAEQKFFEASVVSVAQALLKATSFVLIILLWKANVDAVAISYYLMPFLAAFLFLLLFRQEFLVRPKLDKGEVASSINRFWTHTAFGVLMLTLVNNVDLIIVQKFLDSFSTGVYAGASKIASFVGMLVLSVGGVLNSRVARYKDKQTLLLYLKKSTILIVLAILGFLLFLPLVKPLIVYTIGPEYLSGSNVLVLLVFNAFLTMIIVPLTAVFYSVDEPSYFSISTLLQVVFIFGVSLIFLPQFGTLAVAWSRVLASGAALICSLIYLSLVLKRK